MVPQCRYRYSISYINTDVVTLDKEKDILITENVLFVNRNALKKTKEKSLFFFLHFPLQAAEASESVSSSIFIVEENKKQKEKITRNEQNILRIKIQKRKEMGKEFFFFLVEIIFAFNCVLIFCFSTLWPLLPCPKWMSAAAGDAMKWWNSGVLSTYNFRIGQIKRDVNKKWRFHCSGLNRFC